MQVTIGNNCRLDPFSVALPGLTLPAGAALPALGTKSPAQPRVGAKAARATDKRSDAWKAAERKISSERLGANAHAALQVRGSSQHYLLALRRTDKRLTNFLGACMQQATKVMRIA